MLPFCQGPVSGRGGTASAYMLQYVRHEEKEGARLSMEEERLEAEQVLYRRDRTNFFLARAFKMPQKC